MLVLALGSIQAQATQIQVDFTVQNFTPYYLNVAPTDPVTGKIIYEAASTTGVISSLISIDLIIGAHTYSISEIGYISPWGSSPERQLIGGNLNDVDSITSLTDDFYFIWYSETLSPITFHYTSSSINDIWNSEEFSSFSVSALSPVPEPTSMLLLGLGLVGLAGARRKFKK